MSGHMRRYGNEVERRGDFTRDVGGLEVRSPVSVDEKTAKIIELLQQGDALRKYDEDDLRSGMWANAVDSAPNAAQVLPVEAAVPSSRDVDLGGVRGESAPARAAYPEYDLIGNPGQTLSEVPLGGYVRKTAEDWGIDPDNALLAERIAAGGAGLLTAGVGVPALIAALQELLGNDQQVTY